MDVGLARLETARRRVLVSRAVPPLSKDASSHGFAMAALLTAMSIMAIALAAALPAWPISIAPQTGGSAAQAGTQAGRGRGGANTPVANEPGGTFLNRLRRGAGRGSGQRGASGPAEGRHTAAPDGRETGR